MVVLIGKVKLRPEKLADAIKLGRDMLAPSRSEPGCLTYDFYQHHEDPSCICFVETWASREALGAHFETAHFRNFAPTIEGFVAEPIDIQIYEVAGVETL